MLHLTVQLVGAIFSGIVCALLFIDRCIWVAPVLADKIEMIDRDFVVWKKNNPQRNLLAVALVELSKCIKDTDYEEFEIEHRGGVKMCHVPKSGYALYKGWLYVEKYEEYRVIQGIRLSWYPHDVDRMREFRTSMCKQVDNSYDK